MVYNTPLFQADAHQSFSDKIWSKLDWHLKLDQILSEKIAQSTLNGLLVVKH